MAGFLIDMVKDRAPDFVVGDPAAPYLRRWWLVPRNSKGNIYLHHILRSDAGRDLHDHPWESMTVVLDGGYDEVTPAGTWLRRKGDVVKRLAHERHRLELGPDEFAWTLFLTGPKVREWGFWRGDSWTWWKDYVDPANPGLVRDR